MSAASGVTLFSPRIIAVVVAASMVAFVLFLWLAAYAGDDRDGRNGGAHALSNGATGFRGWATSSTPPAARRFACATRMRCDGRGCLC